MNNNKKKIVVQVCLLFSILLVKAQGAVAAEAVDFYGTPSFLTAQVPPLVMLVMGKNHKLFYEAYNDASDLNEDGVLDVGYKGEDEPFVDANGNNQWSIGETFTDINGDGKWTPGIDYYGYFDSYKCYEYSVDTFLPRAAPMVSGEPSKKCTGPYSAYWSGDFLNYVTTSRMDAIRKVLYGGYRSTDSATDTVLQRAYIPQDAHTWGKEYESVVNDGYDISEYTPLILPDPGTRHLFASTTLSDNGDPLLRVLPNNTHRIWEWVAKERPVADNSLEVAAGGFAGWPNTHNDFNDMITQFANSSHLQGWRNMTTDPTYNGQINGSGNPFGSDDNYLTVFAGQIQVPSSGDYIFAVDGDDSVEVIIDGNLQVGWYGGHGSCNCNTYASSALPMVAGRNYTLEFRHMEAGGGDNYYLRWSRDGGTTWNVVPATAFDADGDGTSDLLQTVFDLQITSASSITDYNVRVQVCDPVYPETNCTEYPSGALKPEGLLQKYGMDEKMFFGLMSGSYAKNMSGGVLRKNISSITDEIDEIDGIILSPSSGGIIDTINRFRISEFNYAGYSYPGGWVTDRPMAEGEFADWGNPTGEMMYETIRYFAGKGSPTPDFDYSGATVDDTLGLPKPAWKDPYDFANDEDINDNNILDTEDVNGNGILDGDEDSNGNGVLDTEDVNGNNVLDAGEDVNGNGVLDTEDADGNNVLDASEDVNGNGVLDTEDTNGNNLLDTAFEYCAKPFMLVLSDIFPTFDSDQLHGTNALFNPPSLPADDFSTGANNTDILDVDELASIISQSEAINGNFYIGQEDATYDGSCTPKVVDDLGDIRGLCPEEPTKQGSYSAAAVAYYGAQYDVNANADGAQRVSTFAVGLASPLPKINIDVDVGVMGTPDIRRVTMVPFAKSTGGCLGVSGLQGNFQPTNTIVDFFVEEISPTTGTFRVNYEDVEQGADHDMDAIVVYEYEVINGTIEITLTSTYAAGCIEQHMGYIISGTTNDGVYLEVRDQDTNAANDDDYFLDTPPGELPGGNWADGVALPQTATRIFTPGATPGASILENPLYYAAKWGGFQERDTEDEDTNNNGLLDAGEDLNGNGKIDYLTVDEDTNNNGLLDAGEDSNGNGVLDHVIPEPNLTTEWDRDGDEQPDSYFYVVNPLKLQQELAKTFSELLRRAASGTAASVISSSRSGEGAVYQSMFYPEYEDTFGEAVQWVGMVRSLLVDSFGNMRVDMYLDNTNTIVTDTALGFGHKQLNVHSEDLNGNGYIDATSYAEVDLDGDGVLDEIEDLNHNGRLDNDIDESDYDYDDDGQIDYRDLIVVFEDGRASLWDDVNENNIRDVEDDTTFDPDFPGWHNNGSLDTEDTIVVNGILDPGEDLNNNGRLDFEDRNENGILDSEIIDPDYPLDGLVYLWNSRDWLDSFTLDPLQQRAYNFNSDHRYIFTFVDSDGDMIADPSEIKDFISTTPPSVADLTDTTTIFPYLTLYPSYSDKPAWVSGIEGEGNRNIFLQTQAKRVVDYIRGEDKAAVTIGSYSVPAMRSRLYNSIQTWRLGDIINSSPWFSKQIVEFL